MEDVNSLKTKKQKYENLKLDIESIRSELKSAIDALQTPSEKIGELYNLNSIGIDNGSLVAKIQEITDIRSTLYDSVLPNINYKINSLKIEIESMGG